ncbi:MAG: cupredoxin domain-containing protein [Acidobacteria bacterium]|nr:cupredoxin domain-containing protein [Acidobacteriota bacterium]MBI3664509.1 cupredoxin domain-containing protein [Acidobacteriota bacterium]
MKNCISVVVLFLGCLFFVSGRAHLAAQSQGGDSAQVIEMTAKKYEFSPGEIRVKKGTRVQLKIRATDRAHGIKIRLYPDGAPESGDPGLRMAEAQDNFKLDHNQERVIEFVAERPGAYTFRCSVFCGFGHRGMSGKLIVK